MIKFPALGSTVTKPLIDDDASPLAGVTLNIKLVGVEQSRGWSNRAAANRVAEIRRVAALRKGFTQAEAGELWDDGFLTPEGMSALWELAADVVKAAVVAVNGVQGSEGHTPLEILEEIGALYLAMNVVINAQRPEMSVNLS